MKYIAYYRVSTKRQGISGLGLQAQKDAVNKYISPEEIGKEFTEIETGTNKKDRPQLTKAIELCKEHNATLLIAKLDRLARNVSFVSNLRNSEVKFTAVDNPEANDLTINILSSIAQHEAEVISQRIKSALAVKKRLLAKEGKKLGTPKNLDNKARMRGTQTIKAKALNNSNNKRAKVFIEQLIQVNKLKEEEEKLTLKAIAKELNQNDYRTSRGKEFSPMQVSRLIA